MLVLSIDCAGHGCGVAVLRSDAVLAEANERMERGQDQRLMPLVMHIMQKAGAGFDRLDRIAVTRGPGSFTGLRIGLAAARGIGLAAGKPVIGIDRFSIYREAFKHSGKDILVVIDSRRKELYTRFYPANGNAHEAAMMTAEEIEQFITSRHPRESGDPESASARHMTHTAVSSTRYRSPLDSRLRGNDVESDVIICGDIAATLFAEFHTIKEPEHIISARLAACADADDPVFLPRPLYIRAPDVTFPKQKNTAQIRAISHADTPLLAELHAESFGSAAWNLAQIEGSLALATTQGWATFEGNAMTGFILCQIIPDQSEVLTFCVRPSHRRRGIGEKLLHAAARDAKAKDLYLETAADNFPALALYRKIGFEQTGRRTGYYQNGAVDALLFTLRDWTGS